MLLLEVSCCIRADDSSRLAELFQDWGPQRPKLFISLIDSSLVDQSIWTISSVFKAVSSCEQFKIYTIKLKEKKRNININMKKIIAVK